jgi:hypothetical protein
LAARPSIFRFSAINVSRIIKSRRDAQCADPVTGGDTDFVGLAIHLSSGAEGKSKKWSSRTPLPA